ncbi:hypothetical protein B9C88_09670 [Brevibacillus laterosporus]|uniref:hypothetical protein n=1 Tax=Brevibacillus laterosporus TaxID=1465 RepID=UPI000BC3CCF3|nr:hypothetical protein [Brevibacillus laterosporus]PCN44474.1 hypothetical protein B9C88_09670 [Brevibacillus laterosporus]
MSTKKYDVIADFIDEMTGKIVPAGSIFEADEPRAERAKIALVISDRWNETHEDEVEGLVKLGGGYYELPNGEKVRGKEKAIEALQALKAGDSDGDEISSETDAGTNNLGGNESLSED